MSRSITPRASVLFTLILVTMLARATTSAAQTTPTAVAPTAVAPTAVAPTEATPTGPAAASGVEPLVITAGENEPTPTAAPSVAPAATPAPAASPAPAATPAPSIAPLVAPEPTSTPATVEETHPTDARSCLSLFGVIDHRWNTSTGFDLFSDDNVTQFYGLALAVDLVKLTDQLTLAAEVGWNMGSTHRNALLGGNISRTELSTHNVIAAATARYDLLPWLAPHARMSLGLSVADMTLASSQDSTFKDQAIAPLLGLGIGASLQTPPRVLATRRGGLMSLQLGVRLELGYTLMGSTAFSLHADDDLRVPVTDSSTGGLSRSGPYIQSALFARL